MKKKHIILIIIILSGLLLRIYGNNYGLPYRYAPDEEFKIYTALNIQNNHFLHSNMQPSFLYNTLYVILNSVPSSIITPDQMTESSYFAFAKDKFALCLWFARCWIAFLGTLTIFFVYLLGKYVWNKTAGLWSAFFYALSPLAVSMSQYVKEDTPLTLFITIFLLASIKLLREGGKNNYMLCGLLSGFAFSAKYPGAVTFLVIILVYLFRNDRKKKEGKYLLLSAVLFFVGFFIFCPNLIVNIIPTIKGIYAQAHYLIKGHHDGISYGIFENFLMFHLKRSVVPGVTLPVLISALAGILILRNKNRQEFIILALWTSGYYLLAELSQAKPYPMFARYILPIIPLICIFAGIFVAHIIDNPIRIKKLSLNLAFFFFILVFFAMFWLRTLSTLLPDQRAIAQKWIYQNIPIRTALYTDSLGAPYYIPYLDPRAYKFKELPYEKIKKEYGQKIDPAYYLLSSFSYKRFLENPGKRPEYDEVYDIIMSKGKLIKEFAAENGSFGFHNPTIRIYYF